MKGSRSHVGRGSSCTGRQCRAREPLVPPRGCTRMVWVFLGWDYWENRSKGAAGWLLQNPRWVTEWLVWETSRSWVTSWLGETSESKIWELKNRKQVQKMELLSVMKGLVFTWDLQSSCHLICWGSSFLSDSMVLGSRDNQARHAKLGFIHV